jgi:hypothetical protein
MPVISKPDALILDLNTTPLTKKPKRAKKVELKNITINTYTSKLRAFHKRMTGLPLSVDIINAINGDAYDKKAVQAEFKYLYDRIDEIRLKEQKAIANLCKIFTKITGFVRLIKILTPAKKLLEKQDELRRNETTIQQDKLIDFNKETIILNALKLPKVEDRLLYLLMTLIPTRRLDDYRSMTIGKSGGNYYENGRMFISEASTKNKKSIIIATPTEIQELLPSSGNILGKEYSQSALSKHFIKITEAIYNYPITANEMRRMFLTTINNSGASYLQRQEIADAVGNSVSESIKYALKVV